MLGSLILYKRVLHQSLTATPSKHASFTANAQHSSCAFVRDRPRWMHTLSSAVDRPLSRRKWRHCCSECCWSTQSAGRRHGSLHRRWLGSQAGYPCCCSCLLSTRAGCSHTSPRSENPSHRRAAAAGLLFHHLDAAAGAVQLSPAARPPLQALLKDLLWQGRHNGRKWLPKVHNTPTAGNLKTPAANSTLISADNSTAQC